ncbi:MAG TPA: hypothetical protein VGI99_07900, partial [Gemmataceae bacterium]
MNTSLFLLALLPAAAPVNDIKLPPGFTAHLYSDQALANDIYTMTVDDSGRVLVAGRGYVRVLVDDNNDGRADRAIDLIDGLKGDPMGLLAEGDSLYVVADGGLKRYRGYNGKDKLKGPPETIYAVKSSGEHEAHAVRRGPDGWLYLICGNNSGVKKDHLDSLRSPVTDPVAGSLLRISPDGKTIEAVCDGFRNAYGFDFNTAGEPFAFDSDNERCVGLPWYEPCRFYHIVPGGNHGWRSPQLSQTWRKPPYFADVVPPVCTTGRGSPTGVVCYRNAHFPEKYRGNFFIADWTFGKVWFVPLERRYSTFTAKPEVFLEAVGESGFAPTALAVHPKSGELLVSIGGRGTRGAVYRVSCDKGGAGSELPMATRSLDWDSDAAKQWVKEARSADDTTRRHALEMMLRWRDKLGWGQWLGDAAKPNLSHPDALVRAAAGRLVAKAAAPVGRPEDSLARLTIALLTYSDNSDYALKTGLEVLESPKSTLENKLIATRVVQLALGDLTDPKTKGTLYEGYTFREPVSRAKAAVVLRGIKDLTNGFSHELPATTEELDFELARILAGIGGDAIGQPDQTFKAEWLARHFYFKKEPSVQHDIHFLTALSRLSRFALRDVDTRTVNALLGLEEKVKKQHIIRDSNWPLRLDELAGTLIPKHEYFTQWLMRSREKLARPEHLAFMKYLRIKPEDKAGLYMEAGDDPNYPWTAGVVRQLAALPLKETRPTLVKLWGRGGLEEAILPILAKEPQPDDAAKFVIGLRSLNPEIVTVSAAALGKLPAAKDHADLVAAIVALRKLPDDKASTATRGALTVLLKNRTGESFA